MEAGGVADRQERAAADQPRRGRGRGDRPVGEEPREAEGTDGRLQDVERRAEGPALAAAQAEAEGRGLIRGGCSVAIPASRGLMPPEFLPGQRLRKTPGA